MRAVYKNPKELATVIKDSVDAYLEDLVTYDQLEQKLTKVINANGERVYKNGIIALQISNVLGESRTEIVNKIYNK
ncbi:TIGR04540 family protein [Clostridium sp. 'White wine YQ']|uniref:TIGR04540 family protein n=1 Tax=Clostridium sp. 'White wine YQ' TaxID=3027474 RepID=UPI002366F94C|nr:TIGR04540 family protein [Clostridium sp. 'White wine YQ']MDD7793198.1 TIGR04540 family protein [Clostridium sp. 'White wine YQ']